MLTRISTDNFEPKHPEEQVQRVVRFLRDYHVRSGASKFILGISGGLDSGVAATLCARAVGGTRVLGVHMPEDETLSRSSWDDADSVAKSHRIRLKKIDITDIVESVTKTVSIKGAHRDRQAIGNVKARVRSIILYYFANLENGIVVGTGDKSEIMLGYFTKYGDGACDILPLADFYKTTLRHLAKYLGLPKRVFSKPSSPELWPKQTAEAELGLSYDKLDPILWGLERMMSDDDISEETGQPLELVRSVRGRCLGSEHKRRAPLVLKSGFRTAGADMRMPL